MELDLSHSFDATPEALWAVLLDPQAMAKCVPGMQSVEVISDTEYRASIKVKIAFISAAFNIHATIAEQRPPEFLRAEARGEDSSVGSSVKAICEMRLAPQDAGRTLLTVHAKATVLGRLGTLGLNPMRSKAKSMWDQFCMKLEDLLAGELPDATPAAAPAAEVAPQAAPAPQAVVLPASGKGGLLSRLFRWAGGNRMHVEYTAGDTKVVISCPASQAGDCLALLDRVLDRRATTAAPD